MHPTRIAQKAAEERDRIVATANRIAKRLPDLPPLDVPVKSHYPEMLPLVQLSAVAEFLDDLDRCLKDEGYSAAVAAAEADDTDAANDAPETPETDEAVTDDVDATDGPDAALMTAEPPKRQRGRA